MAAINPLLSLSPRCQNSLRHKTLRALRIQQSHQHLHTRSTKSHTLSTVAQFRRPFLHHAFPTRPPSRLPLRPHRRPITTRAAATNLFRRHPLSMAIATIFLLITSSTLIYINYYYRQYILLPFHPYPEPVAQSLRKAVYYTNVEPNPKSALKYYKQALERAAACGMDPMGDAVIGVRIQIASMLEGVGRRAAAARVLEVVKEECVVAAEAAGRGEDMVVGRNTLQGEGNVQGDHAEESEVGGEEPETLAGRRRRLLECAVKAGVLLGQLYSHEDIHDTAMAEERLVWAVTTLLKERQRRETEGVQEGEGQWFASGEEIGGALEALAAHYFDKGLSYLAVPLYLQTLTFLPPKSCHAVTIMNNLAVSLSLQSPPADPTSPPASPTTYIADAQTWAHKALALANSVEPPDRNEECDDGCCAAMISLGDFYRMVGSKEEARRWWRQGVPVCKAVGGETGRAGASKGERGLRELEAA